MWLKNGTGVAIRRLPVPSSASESSICVSEVFLCTLARRISSRPHVRGGRGDSNLAPRGSKRCNRGGCRGGCRPDPIHISQESLVVSDIMAKLVAPMAKPLRSPVLGYNHNVRYHGRVFHVQTED